ncbi:hypothetical protein SRS16CHR_01276 [Variovorax sp. SRS16]|nr:hypothetical protein SRS16CHR_01276 [Variovorax sp. SRS16]
MRSFKRQAFVLVAVAACGSGSAMAQQAGDW